MASTRCALSNGTGVSTICAPRIRVENTRMREDQCAHPACCVACRALARHSPGMILERVFDSLLAQAGYLVGCEITRTAIVIDPNRDVDRYIEVAQRERLTITHVTETHIHADFVSGARELARRTGASCSSPAPVDPTGNTRLLKHQARACCMRETLSTWGRFDSRFAKRQATRRNTSAFVVTDRAVNERPIGMATGDFIFVGDVGRPDLLERAAKVSGSMDTMARTLFRSLRAHACPSRLSPALARSRRRLRVRQSARRHALHDARL